MIGADRCWIQCKVVGELSLQGDPNPSEGCEYRMEHALYETLEREKVESL